MRPKILSSSIELGKQVSSSCVAFSLWHVCRSTKSVRVQPELVYTVSATGRTRIRGRASKINADSGSGTAASGKTSSSQERADTKQQKARLVEAETPKHTTRLITCVRFKIRAGSGI